MIHPHSLLITYTINKEVIAMRPITTQSKNRISKSNTKSMSSLHEFKKTAQNFPALKNEFIAERTNRVSFKDLKGKGKLHLGNLTKPTMILSKEERLNPWAKRTTISEEVLNKKGLLNLVHMGVITKQYDCMQLLNNKYEVIVKKQPQASSQQEKETFMTNPVIMDAYYELSKKNELEEEIKEIQKNKEKIQKKAIRKRSSTKKKVIKNQEPNFKFIIEDVVKLSILNFHVQKNEMYNHYVKKLIQNGLEHVFKIYIKKVQQFTIKYNLKKITLVPQINQTRRITQKMILSSIVNHRLFGIDLKVKGTPIDIFRWFLLSKLARIRYRNMEIALKKIEKIKNQFKIKKYYREMIDKRWKFVNFKLGSFAENQRRLLADNMDKNYKPQVQIHILASNTSLNQLQTYYKWNQRKKAQLTRLYNNQSDHIILILNKSDNLQNLVEEIHNLPTSWKKPKIHIFYSTLSYSNVEEYADLYFGLKPEHIRTIKRICDGRSAVLIPYFISSFLPNICESLGVNLLAGSFTQESKSILFEQDEEDRDKYVIAKLQSENAKFKRLKMNSKQLNIFHLKKFKQITLASELYQSKTKAKQLFQSLKIPTPVSVCIHDMNEFDFFRQLVRLILTYKNSNKWILKLPDSTFSRGLSFFETESLKIIKQAKKKPFIREEDVEQISKIIEAILVQKIYLPHNSLMNGDQFITLFKETEGYIECFLDYCIPLGIFGRIETNGVLTLLGSFRKYYAENICFGAMYPAQQVNDIMIKHVKTACSKLYQLGVFGYVTFEILYNERSKEFFFIDFIPHLDQYSSFYFYYRRVLDINELDCVKFTNKVKRFMFYCPFIDNNGNKYENIKELQDSLKQKKCIFDETNIQGFKYLYLNQDVPNVLSIICFSKQQSNAIKFCLDGLRFLVQNGGQFNKFDKKYKNNQSDGLYIMDIIWKMRQIKKEVIDK